MARYQTDSDRVRSSDAAKKTTTLMMMSQLQNSLRHLKNGKAAGLDEIVTEEIKNFGPVTCCCPSETRKGPIGKITGIVLVDLSAAYDTVNHRRLLDKV